MRNRVAAVLLAVVVVSACGGDDSGESATTQADAEAPAVEQATEAPGGTEAPAEETTEAPASGEASRENPVPLGEASDVGDYSVTVVSWEPDSTQTVLDYNEFNEPPPEGQAYALARLSVTYNGDESGMPWADLTWAAVGAAAVAYDAGECYTYPDSMSDVTELFPGGSAEANVCLTIDPSDTGMVLYFESWADFDSERVFFATS